MQWIDRLGIIGGIAFIVIYIIATVAVTVYVTRIARQALAEKVDA